MKYFSEKEAEDFLEKFGFNVVTRKYCSSKKDLFVAISKVGGFPFVMKVSGKKIVHSVGFLRKIRPHHGMIRSCHHQFLSHKMLYLYKGLN